MRGGWSSTLLLAFLLTLLIAVQVLILPEPDRRNFEFFPNMVESVARNAQAAPLMLDDGTVVDLRIPPGSVARDHLPLSFPATAAGALAAGEMLTHPVGEGDAASLARGAFVYDTFCGVCHGPAGRGDGPVTKRGVPPPPSLLLDHAVTMQDGQIFHLLTFGQNNMASYASQVSQSDRWNVIRYVRELQRKAAAEGAS